MPRGGFRRNAGRPPGAKNKPKATASSRPNAKRLKKAMEEAKAMDSLQIVMASARELYVRGEYVEANKAAAKALPYTVQRYGPYQGDAPRSAEQGKQLNLPLPPPPSEVAGEKKPENGWKSLLN